MNEQILKALRTTVERAVRPLQASIKIKRRAREELLAHQIGVFEQELAATGEEQAALARTKERFGDPAELTAELDESVPKLDCVQRFFELSGEAPTSARRAVRRSLLMALQMLVLQGVPLLAVAPILLTFQNPTQVRTAAQVLFFSGVIGATFMPTLVLCSYFLRSAFFDPTWGNAREDLKYSRRKRLAIGVEALLAATALAPVTGGLCYGLLTGDPAAALSRLPTLIALSIGTPICALAIAHAEQKEITREQVWSDLEIAD
ncbi:MAG TPA: hypothetical protein VGJ26_09885 [Pirellulales bacterium]|jgi:hypothetical protein